MTCCSPNNTPNISADCQEHIERKCWQKNSVDTCIPCVKNIKDFELKCENESINKLAYDYCNCYGCGTGRCPSGFIGNTCQYLLWDPPSSTYKCSDGECKESPGIKQNILDCNKNCNESRDYKRIILTIYLVIIIATTIIILITYLFKNKINNINNKNVNKY